MVLVFDRLEKQMTMTKLSIYNILKEVTLNYKGNTLTIFQQHVEFF